jgi:hypothetical protein
MRFASLNPSYGPGIMPATSTGMTWRHEDHLIACGLIGDPVPPVMISGGAQKKNS